MKPGQHYYNHLPQRIREEFSHNCNVRISYVLNQQYESLGHMIDEAFSSYFTKQGKEYWQHVAQTHTPGLRTKATVFVERHSVLLVGTAIAFGIAGLMIAYIVASNAADERKCYEAKYNEQDRVNEINTHNHLVDSCRIKSAIWLPDTSAIKGVIMSSEEWMDSNPLKQ